MGCMLWSLVHFGPPGKAPNTRCRGCLGPGRGVVTVVQRFRSDLGLYVARDQ
jgi:hypothetical protein